MFAENGLQIDMDAVNEILARADVVALGFTAFAERLLVDVRSKGSLPPFVSVVDPVATVQERYAWLGRERGVLGAPQAFSFFVWPHSVRTLRERDVLAPLRARLAEVAGDAAEQLDVIVETLAALEIEAFKKAIRGEDPWRSLWQRDAA